MNTKHCVAVSSIVGGVIGSLLTALLLAPVTAQTDKFGEIECTRLRVVDANGLSRIMLSSNLIAGLDSNIKVRIIGDEFAGIVSTHGRDGNSKAELKTVLNSGGYVGVNNKDGKTAVWLSVSDDDGIVNVKGKDEKSSLRLGVNESGGNVAMFGADGKSGSWVGVNEYGGRVEVYDKAGQPSAYVSVGEHGGHVQVNGKGDGAAVMGINEYGNGGVSTFDKNGYRQ